MYETRSRLHRWPRRDYCFTQMPHLITAESLVPCNKNNFMHKVDMNSEWAHTWLLSSQAPMRWRLLSGRLLPSLHKLHLPCPQHTSQGHQGQHKATHRGPRSGVRSPHLTYYSSYIRGISLLRLRKTRWSLPRCVDVALRGGSRTHCARTAVSPLSGLARVFK